jgi:hypothetical protein
MSKRLVIFQPKSDFQKDDCLFCSNRSTIEAVYGTAYIRCCEDDKCKKKAIDWAKKQGKLFS